MRHEDEHVMPEPDHAPQAANRLVLIADDEEPIAQALSMIVEDFGYTALIATNGRQALELARLHRPVLILTDLMMPFMSGAELIATLRDDARQAGQIPAQMVLLSAAGKANTAPASADAIVTKPFDIRQIEALLDHFLTPK
jgi:adenylate cyclase